MVEYSTPPKVSRWEFQQCGASRRWEPNNWSLEVGSKCSNYNRLHSTDQCNQLDKVNTLTPHTRNPDQIRANYEAKKTPFNPRPIEPPSRSFYYVDENVPKVLPRQNKPSHLIESRPVVEACIQVYLPPHAPKVSFQDAWMEKLVEIQSSPLILCKFLRLRICR